MFLASIFVALLSWSQYTYFSYAFNVDFNHPIIVSNLVDGPESYFGATVQLFKKNDDITWIMIGAPRANSSYSKHAGIHEPGTIWRCSLGKVNDTCAVVVMDPTREDVPEQSVKDRKDEGWLGGSMSGDESDRFVTCAGRWTNQKFLNHPHFTNISEYFFNGICYWRPKNDVLQDNIPDLPSNYRLLPLSSKETIAQQSSFNWQYAQSGFSMHVSSDNKLILGAPGISNWKGSVIQYSDINEPVRLQRNGQPAVNSNTFAESLIVRPELSNFLKNNSYFGYSVSSGKFFAETASEKKIQYVGGAPRGSSLMGQVVVFYFPKNESEPLNKLAVIEGTQIGSYFGSVLCVVDINKDGIDDLIIGAPRFSTKRSVSILPKFSSFSAARPSKNVLLNTTTTTTSTTPKPSGTSLNSIKGVKTESTRGDEGAVFVYMSSGDSLDLKVTIQGANEAWAQFGTSIASAGDLNNDGFNDIVIGAPYAKEGTGSIFIYHGTAKGISAKYSQVIYASQIDSSVRGFGYSLSRGVDIDNNGYNDIAVGSYESSQVIILRTRPSAVITGHVNASLTRLPLNATQFQVASCVTFTGFNMPRSITIEVKVFIDVDAKPHRVVLSKPEEDEIKSNELTYTVLAYRNTEKCTTLNGWVELPLDSNQPVKIRQETLLPESDFGSSLKRGKRSAVHPTKYDIRLSAGTVNLDISGIPVKEFCSECPLVNSQQQNATIFSLPLEVLCGEDDKCTADLRVEAFFVNMEPGANFTIGSAATVTLVVGVKNFHETALSPAIIVSYTRRNLVRIPPSCQTNHVNSSLFYSYKCSLGKMLVRDQVAELSMEFDMSDLVAGGQTFEKEYVFHIEAVTSSELAKPAALDLILPINATADVHISGNRDTIAFSPTTLATYQILSHIYNIRLHGSSTISSMWLRFQLPVNVTDLQESVQIIHVYHPKAEVDGIEMHCTATNGAFDRGSSETSLKEKQSKPDYMESDPNLDAVMIQSSVSVDYPKSGRRPRRDLKKPDPTPDLPKVQKQKLLRGKQIFFECASQFVDCMEVLCKFKNFKASSRGSVIINMRISTNVTRHLFQQEFADEIGIISMGEIMLMDVDGSIQLGNEFSDTSQASTTIKLDRPKRVPKWIYFVSTVAGVILLACVIFGLYYCGCLSRKPPVTEEITEEDEADGENIPLNETPETDIPNTPLEPIQEELEENST